MIWKLKEKARDILSNEIGTLFKEGAIRVALAYPNTYEIGTSNLGFQLIYRILNSIPYISAERVYLPDQKDIKFYESGEDLFSLESQRKIGEFDIIAFSIPFEGDYINVLKILELSKIPLHACDREESYPLVLAGGMATLLNPEPLSPFIDAFIIGEGEYVTKEVFEIMALREPKRKTLAKLSEVEGVYVPSFFESIYNEDGTFARHSPYLSVRKRFVNELDLHPAGSTILTKNTTFSDMYLIEVSRGCGGACRFCAEGFVYRYPRHRNKNSITSEIKRAKEMGRRVGLISPMLLDHPDLKDIISEAKREGIQASLSSLRADALNEDMLETIRMSGQKTLTIAPEAGSDFLRRSVNKHFTNEDIVKSAELSFKFGITNLKLYFMVGLPGETDEDVKAIGELGKDVREVFTRGKVTLGINPLVPKPWTPFQWAPFPKLEGVERKYRIIKSEVKGISGIELSLSSPRLFYVQALLSRGSERVSRLLELALKERSYAKGLRKWELNPDFYTYRERRDNETFPWDFIDHGISKRFLRKEYEKSFEGRKTPECVVPICKLCGVC